MSSPRTISSTHCGAKASRHGSCHQLGHRLPAGVHAHRGIDPVNPEQLRTAPASSRRKWSRAGVGRRWDSGLDRAVVQPRWAAAVAIVRGAEHRQADRGDRGGPKLPRSSQLGNLDTARDIMDVRDTVRAYRAMMQSAKPGVPYNVCSGTPVSIRDAGRPVRVEGARADRVDAGPATLRPNDMPIVLGDRTPHSRRYRMVAANSARADGRRSAGVLAPADRLTNGRFSARAATIARLPRHAARHGELHLDVANK